MVAHVYNASTQEDCDFEASLGYIDFKNQHRKKLLWVSFLSATRTSNLNSHAHISDLSSHPRGQGLIHALLGPLSSSQSTQRSKWRPLVAWELSFIPLHIWPLFSGVFPLFLKSHLTWIYSSKSQFKSLSSWKIPQLPRLELGGPCWPLTSQLLHFPHYTITRLLVYLLT